MLNLFFPDRQTQIKGGNKIFLAHLVPSKRRLLLLLFLKLLIVIIFTLKVVNLNDIIAFIQTISFICYSHGRMEFFSCF